MDNITQNLLLSSGELEEERHYWLKKLAGAEQLTIYPPDFSRGEQKDAHKTSIPFTFPEEVSKWIVQLVNGSEHGIYMVLLSGINCLLYRYTGYEDLIIGMPVFKNDATIDLSQLLAIRTQMTPNDNFRTILHQVKQSVMEADQYQNIPIMKIFNEVGLVREDQRLPAFPVVVSLRNIHKDVHNDSDLLFRFHFSGEQLTGEIVYSNDLFYKETVKQMFKHLFRIFTNVMENSSQPLTELQVMSEEEANQIIHSFNQTERAFARDKTITDWWEIQVTKTPDQIAVVYKDQALTYKEVDERANQIAWHLQRHAFIQANDCVGVMVERTEEVVISLLAVLKSGAAYVPIDPTYPTERIAYMIQDSKMKAVVTQSAYLNHFEHHNSADCKSTSLVVLDRDQELIDKEPVSRLDMIRNADNLAYVIYTSGSTGNPKGVMVTHRNVGNFFVGMDERLQPVEGDTFLSVTTISFDISVLELLWTMTRGIRLVLVDTQEDTFGSYDHYLDQPHVEMITMMQCTPSRLKLLLDASDSQRLLQSLRILLVGGEAFPAQYIDDLHKKTNARIFNMYGPTETTIWSAVHEMPRQATKNNEHITIGKPIANTQIYILDQHQKLTPIGVQGEICIAGEGVAKGYLNRIELTEKKFVTNPFGKTQDEKMFKTGDIGKWLPDGTLQCLGRADHLVKIRGYRIELGEIEHTLNQHPGISNSIVLAEPDHQGDMQLLAFLVMNPEGESETSTQEIREYIMQHLPAYMLPHFFSKISSFPLKPNGKIDRQALSLLTRSDASSAVFEEARDEEEAVLISVWSQVLGEDKISIHDRFIDLGGDSIKAMRVVSELYKRGYKIQVKSLFEYPTILELRPHLQPVHQRANQEIVQGIVPLTPIQHWFFAQRMEEKHHYNQSVMLDSKSSIDYESLIKVLDKLTAHHDALRMAFRQEENAVVQTIRDTAHPVYECQVFDLTGQSKTEKEVNSDIQSICRELQSNLDLWNGKLCNVGLFHTDYGDHLFLTFHHLIVDSLSLRILIEDVEQAYQLAVNNQAVSLPDKTDSYLAWSQQLYEYATSSELQKELSYWEKIREDFVEAGSALGNMSENERLVGRLSASDTQLLLKEVHRAYNTQIYDILLTGLGMSLRSWKKSDMILIDVEGHGRHELSDRLDITRTVGWFTTLYPILLDMRHHADLSMQIKEMKELLKKVPNQGIGYGLLKYLGTDMNKQALSGGAQATFLFNYLGEIDEKKEDAIFQLSSIQPDRTISSANSRTHQLIFTGMIQNGELTFWMDYDRSQFSRDTMQNVLDGFFRHLQEIIRHCTSKKTQEFTPSDFGDNNLSMSDLDDILSLLED
ncbi:amino acid adenylation domain-containing protein [Brevibacillus laterosporus]|uniref:amino acid adenylation domain-containing protein n=1 Tax=Brevibacillus laterosporus TaxID=1465 RepID=UPI00264EED9A|nr:amino acid adenylation domain-containing protein [Brevibacillus laterosporus]MDN9009502.1 amino acid adenylation domain-containing protein [Brevibacillus laterosporus]MDO0940499.1 amino acid adenylation domain-containing protein [Brevibacillus laterosporus]